MRNFHFFIALFFVFPSYAYGEVEKPPIATDAQLLKNCCSIPKIEKERGFMKPLKKEEENPLKKRRILLDFTNTYNGFDTGSGRIYLYSKSRHRIGIEYEESFK